jgi:hypothetical protein
MMSRAWMIGIVKIVRREARSFLAHRITIAVACSIVIGLGLVRVYFGFIPRGASLEPWLLGRVNGPELRSPDGQRSVRVYFNDAGAMHRGNHWTWVIETRWWCGRRVVAAGYLGPDVAVEKGPVPLEWGPKDEIRVRFLPGRDSGGSDGS